MEIKSFNEVFTTTQYPAGEQHIELIDPHADIIVADQVRDWNGLMNCLIGNEILERTGVSSKWVVPYMPFARHDRRNHRYDGLELQTAINIVHSIDGSIIDPHSDVAGVLPHYTQAHVVRQFIDAGMLLAPHAVVAVPDAGAVKKVSTWLPKSRQSVQCLKVRDTSTGKLSGFQVVSEDDLDGRPVVIVDDLCDAGGTFLGLAKSLKEKGAGDLTLAVTHGLFTKGVDRLLDQFTNIYTLDIYDQGFNTNLVKLVNTHDLIRRNYTV